MNNALAAETDAGAGSVAARLQALRAELGNVRLLAVSKGQPTEKILQALAAGQRDFGENFLQAAQARMQSLSSGDASGDIRWHFIGRLQSNKAKRVAGLFSWVHSVDRASLLAPLAAGRRGLRTPLNVCLQVNMAGIAGRPGVRPEQLPSLAAAAAGEPLLHLRGLMCMASPQPAQARLEFGRMRERFTELSAQYPQMDTLSMGISGDWRLAVAQGSTLVRIGSAVFGPRRQRRDGSAH